MADKERDGAEGGPRVPNPGAKEDPLVRKLAPGPTLANDPARKLVAAPEESTARSAAPVAGGELPPTSELVIRLDNYDDIFSDFDPRPLAQRELSDDLLKELGRRYLENPKGGLEVRFYIPAHAREPRLEGVIRKRLRDHFSQERGRVRTQIKAHVQKGFQYVVIGFGLLFVDLFLTLWQPSEVWSKAVGLILTPSGWFALWTGMDKLVEVPYNLRHMESFYDKFSKCNYLFITDDLE